MNIHGCRKLELVGLEADSLNDDKGANVFPIKLLTEVFSM